MKKNSQSRAKIAKTEEFCCCVFEGEMKVRKDILHILKIIFEFFSFGEMIFIE